jgi:hypothetical protein
VAFAGRWKATLDTDLVVVCPVAALEILAAVRDEPAFATRGRALAAFRKPL